MKSNKIKCSSRDAKVFQQSQSGKALCFLLCGKQGNFAAPFLILFCGESCTHRASSLTFLRDIALKSQCKNCDLQVSNHGSSLPNIEVIHSRVYMKQQYIMCTNSASHRPWDLSVLSWHPLSCVKLKGIILKWLHVQGDFSRVFGPSLGNEVPFSFCFLQAVMVQELWSYLPYLPLSSLKPDSSLQHCCPNFGLDCFLYFAYCSWCVAFCSQLHWNSF